MERIKNIFWSSRPVSWVNTAFPFAASYIVISGKFDLLVLVGTIYFLIPYNLLMYGINDVFDYESDLNNPRKQGIEGIVLAKKYHKDIILAALLFNIPFLIYLALNGTVASNMVLLFSVFMVVAYSAKYLRFKEIPLLDSFTSATHFVSPMIFALVLVGWQSNFIPYIISFYCWAMASHAFGAVQDIIPDRKAKIHSIATKFGAKNTVRLALCLYLISSISLFILGISEKIVAISTLIYSINIYKYVNITDKNSASSNTAWKRFMKLNYFVGFVITIVLIINF